MFKRILVLCIVITLIILSSCSKTKAEEVTVEESTEVNLSPTVEMIEDEKTEVPEVETLPTSTSIEEIAEENESVEEETIQSNLKIDGKTIGIGEEFLVLISDISTGYYSPVCEYTEHGETALYFHTETGKDTVTVRFNFLEQGEELQVTSQLKPPQFRSFVKKLDLQKSEQSEDPGSNFVHNSVLHTYSYPDNVQDYFLKGIYKGEVEYWENRWRSEVEITEIVDNLGNVMWEKNMEEPPRELNLIEQAYIDYDKPEDVFTHYFFDQKCWYGPRFSEYENYIYENWSFMESQARAYAAWMYLHEEGYWFSTIDDWYDIEYRWLDSIGKILLPKEDDTHIFFEWSKWNVPRIYETLLIPDNGRVVLQSRTGNEDWQFVLETKVEPGYHIEISHGSRIKISDDYTWLMVNIGKPDTLDNRTLNWSEDKILEYFEKWVEKDPYRN